jgi:hypothetical protein
MIMRARVAVLRRAGNLSQPADVPFDIVDAPLCLRQMLQQCLMLHLEILSEVRFLMRRFNAVLSSRCCRAPLPFINRETHTSVPEDTPIACLPIVGSLTKCKSLRCRERLVVCRRTDIQIMLDATAPSVLHSQ